MRRLSKFLAVSTLALSSVARADFTPPKDGKLTEKQLTSFIEIQKEQMDIIKSTGNAAAGTSGTASLALAAHMSEKIDAAVTKNGMTKDEFNWVGEQTSKLWPVAIFQQRWVDIDKPQLDQQIKTRQDDAAANKAKLEQYEQAQKNGTRVLTKDQRDAAVASATGDRDNIAAEVKTDQDALKPINDEIAQHDKDVADDEALAKNPPAEVSADDKNNYIDGKKNDAQTARDAAKDARDRLKEAQKNLDDANTRLAASNGKLAHPDVPVTDDDKAQVKTENDQAITDTKTTISNDDQAVATLKETIAAGPMNLAANDKDKPDPDNLAVVQKHIKEYLDAMGQGDMLKAK